MTPATYPVASHGTRRMIDGLKIPIRGRDQQRLRSHPLLRWVPNGVDRVGRERFIARFGAFTFKGDGVRCTSMRGSFHKHYHEGENWQDFTRSQFIEVVERVCIDLGLHPANLALANLEVGVNIVPPMPAAEVLGAIVLHRTQPPLPMREGIGIEILHTAYRFKIYDKARQYQRPGELLRVEVAARKMRTLAGHSVRTLADLLEPGTWEALSGYLVARFAELLIVEPYAPPEGLRPAEVRRWQHATDAAHWAGMDKRRRSEGRKTLQAIYDHHVPVQLKATLHASITAKLVELNDHATPDQFTDGVRVTTTNGPRTFSPVEVIPDEHVPEGANRTFALHVIKGEMVRVGVPEEESAEVLRCRACGAIITHQDARSKYCSERRTGRYGKSCRNRGSNFTRTLRALQQRGPVLFDQQPFLRVTLGPPQRRNHITHR